MSAYRKEFDETKFMSFFLKKNDSDPVYNKKYLKAKNLIMGKSTQIYTIIK